MKALVVYDSAYGNTEKVARAMGRALAAQHNTEVHHIRDVTPQQLSEADLLVIGSPTQKLSPTDAMRDFIASIPANSLRGVRLAAFDTRISIDDVQSTVSRFAARLFLHRYAAGPIAEALTKKGAQSIIEPEGFYVLDTEGPLKVGELERAAAWVQQIALQIAH